MQVGLLMVYLTGAQAEKSMRLFAEKVLPELQGW
jgi:hypothetical protein